MGDRAEVSHQTRTSDDHALGLGYRMGDSYARLQTTSTGRGPVRLLRRAPHLRCGARLFVPLAGPWLLGRGCAGRRRCGEGAVCVSAPLMVGAYGTGRRTPRGRGHVVAGGDVRRRRGRESCPRTRGLSPAGADRTRPRGMSPRRTACGAGCHHLWTVRGLRARETRRPPRLIRGRPTASSDTCGFTGERTAQGHGSST